ncbi:hypothetical protein CRE_26834 [Caenorhabditis remanei]|uniref:Uncharacterized protein n=1 Tax=Caenorhabditis remanei TaxID=31234 RepID=E3NKK7_CAERE|nr:hypothetical protein CRE_26834 [Caenorhabditis remanei]
MTSTSRERRRQSRYYLRLSNLMTTQELQKEWTIGKFEAEKLIEEVKEAISQAKKELEMPEDKENYQQGANTDQEKKVIEQGHRLQSSIVAMEKRLAEFQQRVERYQQNLDALSSPHATTGEEQCKDSSQTPADVATTQKEIGTSTQK